MPESPYGVPLYLGADRKPIALSRVGLVPPAGNDYDAESWLQNLVFQHPECLPLTAIDSSFSRAFPLCVEMNSSAGPIDAVYITPDGRLILLETKLWRNAEARRKVIGQILHYATAVSEWTYERLEREVANASKHEERSLFRRVKAMHPDVDEAAFFDQVTRNLNEGRFMLLIVGDGIREGAAAIAEFLQNFASLDFSFGLVEVAVFKQPDGSLLVQPRVMAKTVTLKRSVITIRGALGETSDEVEEAIAKPELTELQRFYESFWSEFIPTLKFDDPTQTLPNVTRRGNIFLPMPPSGSEAWITVYFEQSSREVGLFLTFLRGSFADIAYARLFDERDQIDADLGIPTTWSSVDGKYSILSKQTFPDLKSSQQRATIMAFLRDAINRYVNVFRPRLTKIASEV